MKMRVFAILSCIMMLAAFAAGCAAPVDPPAPQGTPAAPPQASDQQPQPTAAPEEDFSLYGIPMAFEDPFAPSMSETNFSDLAGLRYDGFDEFGEAIRRMEEACIREGSLEELKELYTFLYGELVEISTTSAVAAIEYDMDFQNEELAQQSAREDGLWADMNALFREAVNAVLASPYGEDFAAFIGKDVAEGMAAKNVDLQKSAELTKKETELVIEYQKAVLQPFVVTVDGQEWDEPTLYDKEESLSDEEYNRILNAILEKKNQACVPLYLELAELRKEMAALYGYEDVAEYYYEEEYSRDYSPREAQAFHASVKKHIVPAYEAIRETKAYRSDAVVTAESVLPAMEAILPRISPEMAEIFQYMTQHEMIYLTEDLDVSMDTGYTMALSGPAQPFVYNAVYSEMRGLLDTFHEFGHYCDYYLNGTYGPVEPEGDLDQAEVCSMGLEMLLYAYYDEMFEGDTKDEKLEQLYTILGNIISGCMYDEAQQRVFAYEGELTAEVVNRIFREVAAEYGKDTGYDQGLVWVEVHHTFSVPFYYLSYAAAASAAMEIWLTAREEGQEAAVDLYLNILSYGSFEYGYEEMLDACGMRGFRSEAYMAELANTVMEETDALLADAGKKAA